MLLRLLVFDAYHPHGPHLVCPLAAELWRCCLCLLLGLEHRLLHHQDGDEQKGCALHRLIGFNPHYEIDDSNAPQMLLCLLQRSKRDAVSRSVQGHHLGPAAAMA